MMCRDRREIQTPPLPQRNVLKSSSLMHRILLACVVFDSLHLIVLVHPTNNFLHLFSSFGTAWTQLGMQQTANLPVHQWQPLWKRQELDCMPSRRYGATKRHTAEHSTVIRHCHQVKSQRFSWKQTFGPVFPHTPSSELSRSWAHIEAFSHRTHSSIYQLLSTWTSNL